MIENTESTISVTAGAESVCRISTFTESGIPAAYRLIRRKDGNGNMIPMLQGLFTWTEDTKRGAEWRDLETQDEPYVKDDIPFSQINW
jgi:predicted lipoprotein with Yx(FWY)xxD motif